MGGAETVQVGAHDRDCRLMDGLPLIVGDEFTILVLDSVMHRGSRFIARGEPNIRVNLAILKGPKDRLRIASRALRWMRSRERERRPGGYLGGRVARAQRWGMNRAGSWGSCQKRSVGME